MSATKRDRDQAVRRLLETFDGQPRPARRTLSKRVDQFKQQYPRLYEVMFRDVDSPRYRAFEMLLEQEAERQRRRVGRYGPAEQLDEDEDDQS